MINSTLWKSHWSEAIQMFCCTIKGSIQRFMWRFDPWCSSILYHKQSLFNCASSL